MNTTQTARIPFRLAVCHELLGDGCEWSIYAINALAQPATLVVEHVDWEWGDMGHAKRPGAKFSLPSKGVARMLRVDGADGELSMSVTVLLTTSGIQSRLSFSLGKLYLYRDPEPLDMLGLPGWLRTADESQRL